MGGRKYPPLGDDAEPREVQAKKRTTGQILGRTVTTKDVKHLKQTTFREGPGETGRAGRHDTRSIVFWWT